MLTKSITNKIRKSIGPIFSDKCKASLGINEWSSQQGWKPSNSCETHQFCDISGDGLVGVPEVCEACV